jgi:very-short-patch-repair endonuclease
MTPAEKKLWPRLRAHRLGGVGFRRQHPIGPYIVDFCAPQKKIIIEVDGEPHASQKEYDSARSEYLGELGFTVIRFWNHEVISDIDAVLIKIKQVVDSTSKLKST